MGIVARQHSSSVDGFIADRHGDQPAIPAWRAPMVMAPIMHIMLSNLMAAMTAGPMAVLAGQCCYLVSVSLKLVKC